MEMSNLLVSTGNTVYNFRLFEKFKVSREINNTELGFFLMKGSL